MKDQIFSYTNNGLFPFRYVARKGGNPKSAENLNRGFRTVGVSEVTRKKIAKHCRVLGLAAQPQRVRNGKGEYITHLCSFVTLTLPAAQWHDDATITKEILGTFLDRARKLGIFSNYVWRAEKQKNGSIHYHLISDSYASFSLIRRLWYLSLRRLGYLEAYTDKFSKMSFAEYTRQPFNRNREPAKVAAAFARGTRSGWQEPPCVDVSSISNIEGVARYVSKYVSKADPDAANIVTGRTWGSSQSVSAATAAFTHDQTLNRHWYSIGAEMFKRPTIYHDYFSFVKFKISSLLAWFPDLRQSLADLFRDIFTPCQFGRRSLGIPI